MTEEWKPIEGTDGGYHVSNLGRVMSLKQRSPRIMPATIQKTGYKAVMLWMNNKAKCVKVHRLVAEAFVPNPDHRPQINHKDGDKLNNQATNLEWCTGSENMQHASRTGLLNPHQWTEDERKEIAERNKQYAIDHGYQPKHRRTWDEYIADRKREAEERKAERAKQPKPPRKTGWKWSDEARRAASVRQTGKPHPHKPVIPGWKWSDEQRQRMSDIKKAYYERKRRESE